MADVAYAEPQAEAAPKPQRRHSGLETLLRYIKATNLCDEVEPTDLARMGAKVCEEFDIDIESRKREGWEEKNKAAMDMALQVREAKTTPWPNASNVKYPLVTVAAIQFNARAYPAIVDGWDVVKGKVLGKPSDDKRARADRVARHMSYQLLDEMPEWEEDTDQLLLMLPCTGNVFRKSYFDPYKQRNASELITAEKFVVNYWAKPLSVCPRATQVCEYYPHEIEERMRSGTWRRVELGRPVDANNDDLAPHQFLEQHRLWDLDDDDYPEPYIITVHKETMQVVRIVARYDEDGVQISGKGEVVCIEPVRYFTKYGFIPSPDGSFYDIGFGTLLNALNSTINTTINQLMDAGTLANMQGGLIGSGVSIKSGVLRHSPGEWKKVEVNGLLKDNVFPIPTKEPSAVLFQMLTLLIEAAKDITATKDILTGETQQANQPVGTTLAMIEQGLKVFTAIYKRIHRSLKQELQCLFRLNRLYLSPQAYFNFQDEEGVVAQDDYQSKDVGVIPVSDPTVVTDMQRLGRAQFLMQFRPDPLMDGAEINRRVLEAASIEDVKGLFAKAPPPPPPEVIKDAKTAEQKDRELALKEREVAVSEAQAKANLIETWADILVLLKTATTNPVAKPVAGASGATPAPGPTTEPANLTEITALLDGFRQLAEHEVQKATDDIQSGQLGPMAGSPPDPGVPPVPPGPAIDPGQGLGGGGAPVAGPPDQGPTPGGVGGPPVG